MTATQSPSQASGALRDWRDFGARRYRNFRVLAVAQGIIGALSGPAIVIPLLLALGAHPALATLIAVLPVAGSTIQRLVPGLLDRTDGNLRGLTVLAATLGEPRGLPMAAIAAGAASGLLPAPVAIGGIAVIVATQGSLAAVGYGLLQSWYLIILPDDERRLIGPRLAGITLGIGSVILLPIALLIDGWVAAIGLYAYVIPLAVAGVAGLAVAAVEPRLPSPGRVRVPRKLESSPRPDERLLRLARVLMLASLAAGLCPFLTVYAISVLHTGPGFAIAISAVSSAALVISSLVVSTKLRGVSASRLLRRSFLLRGVALLLGISAFPGNPLAPAVLIVVAILLAVGDTAGQLSGNERLYRLATGPSVIAFQSGYVVHMVGSYSAGMLAGAAVMLLGGFPSFAILFASAGAVRFLAARATETSESASVPEVASVPPRPPQTELSDPATA